MERVVQDDRCASAGAQRAQIDSNQTQMPVPRRRSRFARWAAVLWLAVSMLAASWALATTYYYDGNGRLVVTTNNAGSSDRYLYDDIGNLSQIDRLLPGELAIFGFNPGRGAPGVEVKLQGQGFSEIPAQNIVKFNGVIATVTAATQTTLTTLVPGGASTGPITVKVSNNTVSSPIDFIVDANAKPPTITQVSPLIAQVGTEITVTGQTLYPVADQTTAWLNSLPVVLDTKINSKLTFAVPTNTGSGHVTVNTPFGTTNSQDTVLVVPVGIDPDWIDQVKTGSIDGPAQVFSVNTAGHYAAELFDGSGGDYLSLQFTEMTAGNVTYTIYDTGNQSMVSGTATIASPTVHIPKLPATGTYLVLMKPTTAGATWKVAIERNKPITIDGNDLSVTTTVADQSKAITFNATAGQKLGLGISDLVLTGGYPYMNIKVYAPNGTKVEEENCSESNTGCDVDLTILATGTYRIVVSPVGVNQTMSFKATLSSDKTGVLKWDKPQQVALSRRGQNGSWTFTGTLGDVLALQVAGQATVPAGGRVYYTVYNPDGTVLASTYTTWATTLNLPNLAQTGQYLVSINPEHGQTMSAQLTLASAAGNKLQIDGQTLNYQTQIPDQQVYITFNATAGQPLGLGISDLVLTGGGGYMNMKVYAPNGTQVKNENCYEAYAGCDVDLDNLVTGTYRIIVYPIGGNQTMSFKATLSTPATGELPPDEPQQVTLPRRGQDGRWTFTGTLGDVLALQIAGQTTVPAGGKVYYYVYNPDGTLLASTSTTSATTLNLPVLPQTGTHLVSINPEHGQTMSAELTLASGVVAELAIDGPSLPFETQIPDQQVYITFNATAGQKLGLGISDLVLTGGYPYMNIKVYAPNGTKVEEEICYESSAGCDVDLDNLVTGTYRIIVSPVGVNQTMSFKATLSTPNTGVLPWDMPKQVVLSRRGQNGSWTFTGTLGDVLALQVAGQATVPAGGRVYYTVYNPDGTVLASTSTTSAATLNLPNLPQTGQYLVSINPEHGQTMSAQLTLASAAGNKLQIDGQTLNYETQIPDQQVYITFNATAGQPLGLGISDLVLTGGGSYMNIKVYAPNGTQVENENCSKSYAGCDVDLDNLVTGTYRIIVSPVGVNQTMSFKATLSTPNTGVLPWDMPKQVVLSRRGQNGSWTFTGTLGDVLALQVAGQTTVPAGGKVYYYVYNPDGTVLASTSTTSAATLNLPNLPQTGQYLVSINPEHGQTMSAQLTLASAAGNKLQIDGQTLNYQTQIPDQQVYITFNATAGQPLGLGISDLVLTGGGGYMNIKVYAPNGTQVENENCSESYAGCDVDLDNLVTGTYRIIVYPLGGNQTMSFKATLSTPKTGVLPPDEPQQVTLPRRGQDGRWTFTGTLGDVLALQVAGQTEVPEGYSVWYAVYNPDGTLLKSIYVTSATTLNLPVLPQTGTHLVSINPQYGQTMSAQLTLDSTP